MFIAKSSFKVKFYLKV